MDNRLMALEEKLMYLEQQISDLDQLVLELNQENTAMKRELKRLNGRVQDLADGATETPRTLEDDKPPHW